MSPDDRGIPGWGFFPIIASYTDIYMGLKLLIYILKEISANQTIL